MNVSAVMQQIVSTLDSFDSIQYLSLYRSLASDHSEETLSVDDLFDFLASQVVASDSCTYPLLFVLTQSEPGREVLTHLFQTPDFNAALNEHIQSKQYFFSLLSPVTSGEHQNKSAFHNLLSTPGGLDVLTCCFENEHFKLAFLMEPIFQRIFFNRRLIHNQDSSFFDCLLSTKRGVTLLQNMLTCVEFKAFFLQNPQLITALFSPLVSLVADAVDTNLSFSDRIPFDDLLDSPYKTALLSDWCEDEGFVLSLLQSDKFKDKILNTLDNEDIWSLCFSRFLCLEHVTDLSLRLMSHPAFSSEVVADYRFITCLLTENTARGWRDRAPLARLLSKQAYVRLLGNWCSDDEFKKSLILNEDFIPTLFPVLRRLVFDVPGLQLLDSWISDVDFPQQLFSHPACLDTLLQRCKDGDSINESVLDLLVEGIQGQLIFKRFMEIPSFIALITQNAEAADRFIGALLSSSTSNELNRSGFAMLLNTLDGKKIIGQVMQVPPLRAAFFRWVNISEEVAVDWIWESAAGFALLQSLIKHNVLYLLQEITAAGFPTDLMDHFYIRELIEIGQLDPHIFLFLAATGPCDQTFERLLANAALSPWSTIGAGLSLLDVIQTDPKLDAVQRKVRLASLAEGIALYSERISCNSLVVHLHHLGNMQIDKPQDATPPQLPLPLPAPYIIENVDPAVIVSFNQHITWIVEQPALHAYHDAFMGLANNQTIRTEKDFSEILKNLQSLCALMNSSLLNQRVISDPYPEWKDSMSLCEAGVITSFGEMFTEFSSQPLLLSHLQSIRSESIARYARWFLTDSILETHAPQQAICAALGIPTQLFRERDVYLQDWNATQRLWVAQTIMDFYIQRKTWVAKLIEPLQINPEAYKPVPKVPGKRFKDGVVRISREQAGVQEQFTEKYKAYARSPLFGPSFTMDAFYAFIGNTTCDNPALGDEIFVRDDLSSALEKRAEAYLQKENARIFEPLPDVEKKQALLWGFLTSPSLTFMPVSIMKDALDLIDACAEAVDGPALIKASIERHIEVVQDIQIDSLVFLTPHGHSILSILIQNPSYVEWLFGVEFQVELRPMVDELALLDRDFDLWDEDQQADLLDEDQQAALLDEEPDLDARRVDPEAVFEEEEVGEWGMSLNFKNQATQPILITAILKSKKVEVALRSLFHAPASLFFWLFYLLHSEHNKDLFKPILQFVLAAPQGFAAYNSLMSVLYDMQRSDEVSAEDNALVSNFLYSEMVELFYSGNWGDFWRIARNLVTLDSRPDILENLLNNPGALLSLKNPVNKMTFDLLVHDVASHLWVEKRLAADAAPSAAPSVAQTSRFVGEVGFFTQMPVREPSGAEPADKEADGDLCTDLDADFSRAYTPE